MIPHLIKLAWHRKRIHALLVLEIFASFLVLFAVLTFGAQFLGCYRQPLGFSHENVWVVKLDVHQPSDDEFTAVDVHDFESVLRESRSTDGCLASAGAFSVPYDNNQSIGEWDLRGHRYRIELDEATDGFAEVFGIRMLQGRWFEPADGALAWEPVVVNASLARKFFGDDDPIGRPIPKAEGDPDRRVVGVVDEFRKGGELSPAGDMMFTRIRPGDPTSRPPRNLVVRVRPGAGIELERMLLERLRAVAPSWGFEIERLDDMRGENFRLYLVPLLVGALIGGFLLLMVGLGLVGILWQNVTMRTRELGLRRAAGASGSDVRRQIILEILVMTTASVLLGLLVVSQIPLLGLDFFLTPGAFAAGLVSSLALIYLLTMLCGYYPSWMATLIQPAEALRSE
jgi:putative ABC transport system permease protein